MKICPACHRETFDGRSTCHRCGSDVAHLPALELPTSDAATLASWLPLRSKRGTLHLDISGLRFTTRSGADLLTIPFRRIHSVWPRGASEMLVDYETDDGEESRVRLRVRWAPNAERRRETNRSEAMVVLQTWRPIVVPMFGFSSARKRTVRDREVVRDRWLWSIRALLEGDRYASGRRLA